MECFVRLHSFEDVSAVVTAVDESQYCISIYGPDGEKIENLLVPTPEAARHNADELVQSIYPHDCESLFCDEWKHRKYHRANA